MSISLDSASKALTVVATFIAVIAAWKALPLNEEIGKLQAATQSLDLQLKAAEGRLKEAEGRLKETESGRKLSFDLYTEVRKVLENKGTTPRDEEVLRVLIESLAEDPFRVKLLSVLAVSAKSPETRQSAEESGKFYLEQTQLPQRTTPAIVPATQPGRTAQPGGTAQRPSVDSIDVDVFFCAEKLATSEPIAKRVIDLKLPSETGRWRPRLLPESINRQPGYGIVTNEIRYNVPDETEAAKVLADRLSEAGVSVKLKESSQTTKWYVSIFICQ
jgi:hypothetical protein